MSNIVQQAHQISSESVEEKVIYKVSLEGYWVNPEKRIWKSKDNQLYRINDSNQAIKYIEENDGKEDDPFLELSFNFPADSMDIEEDEEEEAIVEEDEPPSKKTKVI